MNVSPMRRRWNARGAAALLLSLGTCSAAAAGSAPEGIVHSERDSTLLSAAFVQPTIDPPLSPRPIRFGTATGSLSLSIAGARSSWSYGSSGRGALRLGLTDVLSLEIGGAAAGRIDADASRSTALRSEVRARWGNEEKGMWLGWAVEREPADAESASPPLAGLGVWARQRNLDLYAGLEQTVEHVRFVETFVAPGDTIPSQRFGMRVVAATTASLDARWQYRRLGTEAVMGVTLGRDAPPGGWMQSSVTFALTRLVAVYATAGSPAPRWLALDPAAERRASAGLKLSRWTSGVPPRAGAEPRTELDLVRGPQGRCTFQVRAPGARAVEIIGDFTDWAPVAMRRVTGTRWELSLVVPAGIHHVNLRRDGGVWTPPPGLPTVLDGFNGEVGLLVVH